MHRWEPLGRVNPEALVDTRVQLHWATCLVRAVGSTFLDPVSGDPAQLVFDPLRHTLVGRPEPRGHAPALRLEDGALLLQAPGGAPLDVLLLHGHTLGQGLDWLASAWSTCVAAPLRRPLAPPAHTLPAHSVGQGQPFYFHRAGPFQELALWFTNAAHLLASLATEHPGASPVRCGPMDFGLVTHLPLEAGSLAVGMSPGDDRWPQPYWYVCPHPAVEGEEPLPSLAPHGRWDPAPRLAAVLPGSDLVAGDTAQRDQVRRFLEAAITACHALVVSPRARRQTRVA